MLRLLFRALFPLAALMSATGCNMTLADCACLDQTRAGCAPPTHDFLLIEALQGAALASKPKIEVSQTPAYESTRAASGVAAIRLPDSCMNDTAAQVTGDRRISDDVRQNQAIVQTQCGVWLAELEKALARAQFRVVSWDALQGLERSEHLPSYRAAEKLGADVLFLLNSVEAPNVAPGGKAASRLRYYRSNERGERLEPYPMTEAERTPLRVSVEGVMQRLAAPTAADPSSAGVTALAAMLDATAVLTKSGESIWFYRNRTVKPLQGTLGRSFLFVRYMNAWNLTRRDVPQQVFIPQAEVLSAEDSTQTTVGASRDPFAVKRLDLVRTVAQDFVDRYRSGRPGEG